MSELPIATEMYGVLDDLGLTLGSHECCALARWLEHREEVVVAALRDRFPHSVRLTDDEVATFLKRLRAGA